MKRALAVAGVLVAAGAGIMVLTARGNAGPPRTAPAASPSPAVTSAALPASAPRPDPARTTMIAPQTVFNVPVSARDPQQGPADALVTLVMFGDLEDKFTQRASITVDELRQKYGDDLRVVWKNVPLSFHDNAKKAAVLAMEAFRQGGNEGFWKAERLLLNHQTELSETSLMGYATELGLAPQQVEEALVGNRDAAKLQEDTALVPRLYPAFTTPLFTINGRFIRGAVPRVVFENTIDEELAHARAMLAAGTPRAVLYERMIAHGHSEPAQLSPEQQAAVDKTYDVKVPSDAPRKGGKHARVVIQEFSDFQCPFCAQAEPVVRALEQQYGDQIAFVWRDYPLSIHPDAALAAQAAREVFAQRGDAKFWRFHDMLFAHQEQLARADLEHYAEQLGGIDMKRFRGALDEKSQQARLQQDVDAYTTSGSRLGTPGFFINGKLIEGSLPIEVFRSFIDRELARK